MVNLEKIIEKDSLRWIGQNFKSLFPGNTIIAGKSVQSISEAIDLSCYTFGKVSVDNVIVAHDSSKIFYVYVNPKYSDYRKLFNKIVGKIPDGYHVDHTLSRNLAIHLGYKYVLLCIIPGVVNARHGHYEKIKIQVEDCVPDICYSDDRIYNKILSRNPTARSCKEDLVNGYTPKSVLTYGLTLKQKGIWNTAFGFDLVDMDDLISNTFLI